MLRSLPSQRLIVIKGQKPISVLRETFGLMVSNDFSIFAMNQNHAVPWIAVTLKSFVAVARIIALLPPPDTSDNKEKLKKT
jgi:hypothetical protein